MKFGLLYFKETANVGDDIQTYAAKRFLPKIDYIIERENTNVFLPKEKEYVSVIMNGWYLYNKVSFPPSPYINPLLVSMHFDKPRNDSEEYIKKVVKEYLKENEPIGVRDVTTQNYLKSKNIYTFFSGCMTLTINKFKNVQKKNHICVVDTKKEVIEKIKQSTKKEVKFFTHTRQPEVMKEKTINERMRDVEELLKEYQSASLVITDRLHAALPSIALGTPTILLRDGSFGNERIQTYEKFANHYTISEFMKMDIKDIIENPVQNKNDYLIVRKKLEFLCNSFIDKAKEIQDTSLLPELEQYKETIKRLEYSNRMYIYIYNRLEEKNIQVMDRNNKIGVLKKDLKYKDQIIENRNDKIKSLKEQNEELLKQIKLMSESKTWKTRNFVVKFLKGSN